LVPFIPRSYDPPTQLNQPAYLGPNRVPWQNPSEVNRLAAQGELSVFSFIGVSIVASSSVVQQTSR
jgi:hypothetical protein